VKNLFVNLRFTEGLAALYKQAFHYVCRLSQLAACDKRSDKRQATSSAIGKTHHRYYVITQT